MIRFSKILLCGLSFFLFTKLSTNFSSLVAGCWLLGCLVAWVLGCYSCFCSLLCSSVLFCSVLFCSCSVLVLFCFVLFLPFCSVLFCSCSVLFCCLVAWVLVFDPFVLLCQSSSRLVLEFSLIEDCIIPTYTKLGLRYSSN